MFELGLGVLLAFIFVAAYLLINRWFGGERRELGGHGPRVSLNPADADRALGRGSGGGRALTAGEMRDHHGGGDGKSTGQDA